MAKVDKDPLERLQRWYGAMCNDCWEHTYGIQIANIDNPGWSLTVELMDTYLFGLDFNEVSIQREDEGNWLICQVKEGTFCAYGGVGNLGEMINVFLHWAEQHLSNLEQ
jgi:hypothetical protein